MDDQTLDGWTTLMWSYGGWVSGKAHLPIRMASLSSWFKSNRECVGQYERLHTVLPFKIVWRKGETSRWTLEDRKSCSGWCNKTWKAWRANEEDAQGMWGRHSCQRRVNQALNCLQIVNVYSNSPNRKLAYLSLVWENSCCEKIYVPIKTPNKFSLSKSLRTTLNLIQLLTIPD